MSNHGVLVAVILGLAGCEGGTNDDPADSRLGSTEQAVARPDQVVVVNPSSHPVPMEAIGTTTVTGTVAISGTPDVNATIVGTPSVSATIAGTPDVNATIVGTPSVSATIVGTPEVNATLVGGTADVNATIVGTAEVNATIVGTPTVNATIAGTPTVNATIAGTPTVNVANTVAVSGTVDVGTPTVALAAGSALTVGGTVEVGNDESNPAVVRNVDDPAFHPFGDFGFVQVQDGDLSGGRIVNVPDGTRLVVDHVSAHTNCPPGQVLYHFVSGRAGGMSYQHILVQTNQGNDGPNERVAVSQPLRAYADPGTEFTIFFQRREAAGVCSMLTGVSGHLVALP